MERESEKEAEILFICEGNVGRSQMAEAYYNALFGKGASISAGIKDVAQKYKGHPTQEIVETMQEEGIDISGHRIKQLRPQMLERAQSIVVFIEEAKLPEYARQFREKMTFVPIDDPFGMDFEGIRDVRNKIKKIVCGFFKA